jgi:hypothetical protein
VIATLEIPFRHANLAATSAVTTTWPSTTTGSATATATGPIAITKPKGCWQHAMALQTEDARDHLRQMNLLAFEFVDSNTFYQRRKNSFRFHRHPPVALMLKFWIFR